MILVVLKYKDGTVITEPSRIASHALIRVIYAAHASVPADSLFSI